MLKQIRKPQARKLFNQGTPVYFNASNQRIGCAVMIQRDWDTDFDKALNAYSFYNCTRETGMYTHFYIEIGGEL